FQTFNTDATIKPFRTVPGIERLKHTQHLIDKYLAGIVLYLLFRPFGKTDFQFAKCGFTTRFEVFKRKLAQQARLTLLTDPWHAHQKHLETTALPLSPVSTNPAY